MLKGMRCICCKLLIQPPGGLSQSKSVDLLFDAMPTPRQLQSTVVPIMYGHVSASIVVVFDFVSQLLSLLQNPNIMQLPITTVCKSTTVLGEALSGSVYAACYITQPSRQLFPLFNRLIARTLQATNGFH